MTGSDVFFSKLTPFIFLPKESLFICLYFETKFELSAVKNNGAKNFDA